MASPLRGFAGAVFALCFGAAPALAQDSAPAAVEDNATAIAQAEQWLIGLQTLTARFVQVAPNGGVAEGDFLLRRPGRLRFDYDPPVPLLIVADGFRVTMYDRELDQPTSWPIAATPFAPMLAEDVDLDPYVTDVARSPGVVNLTLIDPDRPGEGSITLVFQEQPYLLVQWVVIDAAGLRTVVGLSEISLNVPLEFSLFRIERPEEEERD